MLYVRIIVGIALLLMAAFGPGIGLRRVTIRRWIAVPRVRAMQLVRARPARRRGIQTRSAAVLILRILAAMLGLWLLFFSIVQLLHGHGHLPR